MKPRGINEFGSWSLIAIVLPGPYFTPPPSLQGDNPNVQLHLIGFCEAHSGAQGLLIKTLVADHSQAGNVKGTQRRAGEGGEGGGRGA